MHTKMERFSLVTMTKHTKTEIKHLPLAGIWIVIVSMSLLACISPPGVSYAATASSLLLKLLDLVNFADGLYFTVFAELQTFAQFIAF